MSKRDRVYAPWKDEEVESLNACQNDGRYQVWTRRDRRAKGRLVATRDGWIDPTTQEVCQTWAHREFTDWGWLDTVLGIASFWAAIEADPKLWDAIWDEDATQPATLSKEEAAID